MLDPLQVADAAAALVVPASLGICLSGKQGVAFPQICCVFLQSLDIAEDEQLAC